MPMARTPSGLIAGGLSPSGPNERAPSRLRCEIRTFGTSDTVIVLFERTASGRDAYVTGDDDSGEDRNAYIRRRLHASRTYVLRIRLYYAADSGETAVMWW